MTRLPLLLAAALLSSAAACDLGEVDPDDILETYAAAGLDPCSDPDLRSLADVSASDGGHRFVGTNRRDVIFGTPGADKIYGNGGDDIICGLGGDDVIFGGGGRDHIFAGAGADVVHGGAGSDTIWGGPGPDVLFGDILDDRMHGEGGNDVLIGGHGTDLLDGGGGNDFLRGDTGNDTFNGGSGYDIISFATAMPPGQPEIKNDGTANPTTGVQVYFEGRCDRGGCANGDGGQEPLHGVEEIVGSSFRDDIRGGGRTVLPGLGDDEPTPTSTVLIDAAENRAGELIDVGVVVLGSPGADRLRIDGQGAVVEVTSTDGAPLAAVSPCKSVSLDRVRCDVGGFIASRPHRPAPFHFVVAWGGAGDDVIELAGSFPRELEAHASGGEGSDHLIGGDEADVFFTGPDGADWLEGFGGDDALLSESHHTAAWRNGDRPESALYTDGADRLDGGPGHDQLVADYVCGGHRYIGGPGHDIAGFARSGHHPIHAQLGGPATTKTNWWGFAANMDLCGSHPERWTSWRRGKGADLEVLEASDGDDRLWGDDRNDVIWARAGADKVWSLGGNDEIRGGDGRDELHGGSGRNDIHYGNQ